MQSEIYKKKRLMLLHLLQEYTKRSNNNLEVHLELKLALHAHSWILRMLANIIM